MKMNRMVHASFNAMTGFNPSAFTELFLCALSHRCDQFGGSGDTDDGLVATEVVLYQSGETTRCLDLIPYYRV